MFSKNLTIAIALILFLAAGFAVGYLLGVDKSNDLSPAVTNKPASNNQAAVGKINLTAKEAYDVAIGEARAWASDAYLTEIDLASQKFDIKGISNGWKITFYSKTKNKLYEILIKDGESRGGEEKTTDKVPQTLKGEVIDSSALAKSFFGSYPVDTEIINLKMYYDTGAKKFLWTIFFPSGSHTIDAEL